MLYLHIIKLEKFTEGFVNFILNNFDKTKHYFVVCGNNHKFDFEYDSNNVFFIDSYKDVKRNTSIIKLAKKCDYIIINGIFGTERCLLKFPLGSIKKSYLLFWGGDFYCLANPVKLLDYKTRIKNAFKKALIKHAAGVINLIPGEYEELCKYCKPNGRRFVAPLVDDGQTRRIIDEINKTTSNSSCDTVKILVGNSATKESQQMEVFHMIEKFKDHNIEIYCPLSYGDSEYAKRVISEGKKIFGNKFIPLLDYMSLQDYMRLLSEMRIVIFNHNRQQAMGNISSSLGLNCKVYIRSDTPMWNYYKRELGYVINDVSDISNISFDEFISISSKQSKNIQIYSNVSSDQNRIEQWKSLFRNIESVTNEE